METYSQCGQDLFALSQYFKGYKGTFVDIGCYQPEFLNNTYLLEKNNWRGVAVDILPLGPDWEIRPKTKFHQVNALECDYLKIFNEAMLPLVIDYLSLDIEGNGSRFAVLEKILETGRDFGVITIEHDSYRGYDDTEKIPQRKLLTEMGYKLVCSDIVLTGNPFEDWWINPKYIDEEKYKHLISNRENALEIIKKIRV